MALFGRRAFSRWNQALLTVAAKGLFVTDPLGRAVSPGEVSILRKLAKIPEPIVFDVGANTGEYSAIVRRLCPSARIWAFEPNPSAFQELSRRADRYGFSAVEFALSDRRQATTLYDNASRPGSPHATLHEGIIEDLHSAESAPVRVQTTTLDEFITEHQMERIHLLKIDTEGHELRVLQGAVSALDEGRIDLIQFEFNEMNVFYRVFLRDFYELLPQYSLFRVVFDGLVPMRAYRPRTHELFFGHNIVAVSKRSRYSTFFV